MRIQVQERSQRPRPVGASTGGARVLKPGLPAQAEQTGARLTAASSLFSGRDFSSIPVHATAGQTLQAKLAVNQPGDEFEQEADRVARYVMRLPEPQLQRKCACGGTCADCQTERQKAERGLVQMKAFDGSHARQTGVPPLVHEALRSPGHPLDSATHAVMAPRFGRDFSHVRVHSDPVAAESASALNARAYTVGQDVVFGAGEWAPDTSAGRSLLAHELVHVLQQERSPLGVQRQPVGAASSADQEDFVRQTIRFLEQSAEHYGLVARVDDALFDRVIDSWYSMVVRQEQLIDTDLHGNAPLKASLRTAYISALRILVTKRAATSGQTEEDLYRINSGRIPPWAQPHPSHLVPGVTTPIPDDVAVTQRRGRVQFNLNGFDVTVSPDIRVRSQAKPGQTTYHIAWGGVRGRFRRTRAGTTVVAVAGPPTPVVTLRTSYVRGANTADPSGYGRGTTREDKAGARVTPASGSLAFHESRHSQVILDFLRANPPPTFTGRVGDTAADFKAALDQWTADVADYSVRLEQADKEQVHCVGFTIDDFNAAHPQRGRRIAKECP